VKEDRVMLRHRSGWECGPECPLCPSKTENFVISQLLRTNPELALAMLLSKEVTK
jgi:hypothetical protein